MSAAIKSVDKTRLITLGDDAFSMGAPELLCTVEDGLDYYSLYGCDFCRNGSSYIAVCSERGLRTLLSALN